MRLRPLKLFLRQLNAPPKRDKKCSGGFYLHQQLVTAGK
jgi:hypothetical protein